MGPHPACLAHCVPAGPGLPLPQEQMSRAWNPIHSSASAARLTPLPDLLHLNPSAGSFHHRSNLAAISGLPGSLLLDQQGLDTCFFRHVALLLTGGSLTWSPFPDRVPSEIFICQTAFKWECSIRTEELVFINYFFKKLDKKNFNSLVISFSLSEKPSITLYASFLRLS